MKNNLYTHKNRIEMGNKYSCHSNLKIEVQVKNNKLV